jgi:hypothetical protein
MTSYSTGDAEILAHVLRELSYWNRMWTFQEVFYALHPSFLVGDSFVSDKVVQLIVILSHSGEKFFEMHAFGWWLADRFNRF